MDMDDDGGFPVEMAKERILTVCPPAARAGAYAQTAEHARLRAPQELQNTLGPTPFLHSKVDQWSTSIIENVLMKLAPAPSCHNQATPSSTYAHTA